VNSFCSRAALTAHTMRLRHARSRGVLYSMSYAEGGVVEICRNGFLLDRLYRPDPTRPERASSGYEPFRSRRRKVRQ